MKKFTVNFTHNTEFAPSVVLATDDFEKAMKALNAYRTEWESWVAERPDERTVEFDEEKRQVLFTQYRKGSLHNHSCFAWVDDERTLEKTRQPSWLNRV